MSEQPAVNPSSLQRWHSTVSPLSEEPAAASSASSPFPVDERLNRLLVLWKGDVTDLVVDAVVNTTNERLNDRMGVSGRVFHRAGPDLAAECLSVEGCHTGEAVITKGYDLHASHVIHTVGPRFSAKYQTAAENALHGCYRRSLEVLKENHLESIAFPVVNTERKGYPKDAAAHIAFRTIRRFLERYGTGIHTVVIAPESAADLEIYERILPYYFPRNEYEEADAVEHLPKDLGNDLGESVIKEREIRIGSMPVPIRPSALARPNRAQSSKTASAGAAVGAAASAAASAVSSAVSSTRPGPAFSDASGSASASAAAAAVVAEKKEPDPFAAMQEHPDDVRRRALQQEKTPKQLEAEAAQRRYQLYLRRAHEEDLSDLEACNFIYPSGHDNMGRPVVVFVAERLPAASKDLERIMLYLIKVLDELVTSDYTIVYFHTNIGADNKPPLRWLKDVYAIFNRKYKKNLKRLHIVHPSWFVKVVLWFCSPFVSAKFWRKVRNVDRIRDMNDDLDTTTMNFPESVVAYDLAVNGDYYAEHEAEYAKRRENGTVDADDVVDGSL